MKRKYGLDLLKIVSMIMIVTLHYLGKGGALYNSHSIYSYISYGIEALCFVSVNTFVLISGYFLCDNNEVKIRKVIDYLIQLWVINFFISLIIMVVGLYKFDTDSYINMIFPFFSKNNWFLNCYLFIYILHPYINKIINSCTKKEHLNLIIILLLIMTVVPTITSNNNYIYDLSRGYSISWFATLYLIVSYIKKYNVFEKSNYFYIFIYLLCCFSLPVYKYIATQINVSGIMALRLVPNNLYNYNSIPILIASVCLFMLFKNMDIKNKLAIKLIKFTTPLLLGVYLIHEQIVLRQILWIDVLRVNKFYDSKYMIINLVIVVLGIFIVSALLEYLRIRIFTFKKIEKQKDI